MKNLFSSVFLAPFETMVNLCVAQDAKLRRDLAQHTGKILEINIQKPDSTIQVYFDADRIRLGFISDPGPSQYSANASLTGTTTTLLRLMTDSSNSLVNQDLQITGDIEFVQEIYQMFSNLEIDWQAPLSNLVGDVPVHSLETLFKNVSTLGRNIARNVSQNVEEYLHEEIRVAPGKNEVAIFDEKLSALKMDIDRLQARAKAMQEILLKSESNRVGKAL